MHSIGTIPFLLRINPKNWEIVSDSSSSVFMCQLRNLFPIPKFAADNRHPSCLLRKTDSLCAFGISGVVRVHMCVPVDAFHSPNRWGFHTHFPTRGCQHTMSG